MRGGRASYEHAPQPGELASSPTELVGVLPGPLTGHQAGETHHQRKRLDHSCWNWTKKVTTVFWSSGVYESLSDVGEIRVWFASKILTPCRMH